MKEIIGYLRTLRAYTRTRKGRHDSLDYARALLLILATMALALAVVYLAGGGLA